MTNLFTITTKNNGADSSEELLFLAHARIERMKRSKLITKCPDFQISHDKEDMLTIAVFIK